jgi:murein DD-endopeptidase MepM/ murein hydrolase activator NlpD
MDRARLWTSAFLFLAGAAAFASISWIQRDQLAQLNALEPYYLCPVPVVSDRALIRNDSFGKGKFGATRGNKGQRRHKGIDLLAKIGSPIVSSKSGRVSAAGMEKGYGLWVEVFHPDGRASRYAHLNKLSVSKGQWISAGTVLGEAGISGNANDPRIRPHLHYEIREKGEAVDPLKFFEPKLIVR